MQHSKLGYSVQCRDHIVAADYEKQSVFLLLLSEQSNHGIRCYIALIRGLRRLAPCPICLVPKGDLSDLSVSHARRTNHDAQELFNAMNLVSTQQARENIIKPFGLHPVKFSFSL